MKNLKNYFLAFLSVAAFTSCSEDNMSHDNNIESFIFKSSLSSAKNQVFVQVTSNNNIITNSCSIQTDFEENIVPFSINQHNLNEENFNENYLSIGNGQNTNLTDISELGTSMEVSFQGVTEEVYVPHLVNVPSSLFTNNLFVDISKENGLIIPWTGDSANPFGKIFLVVLNRGDRSGTYRPTGVISEVLNDESQSFTISPNTLSDFKVGDTIDIYLARGNEVQIEDTAFVFYNINSMPGRIID
jgi:hypothetical protein